MNREADPPEEALQRLIDEVDARGSAASWSWDDTKEWLHDAFNAGKSGSNIWDDFWRRNKLIIGSRTGCSNPGVENCSDMQPLLEQAYYLGAEAGGRMVPDGFWNSPDVGGPDVRGSESAVDSRPPPDSTRKWIWAGVIVAVGGMLVHLIRGKK